MKIRFLFTKHAQLSDEEIESAMAELRKLREEIAIAEVEAELRRARTNVLVLRRASPQAKGVGSPR